METLTSSEPMCLAGEVLERMQVDDQEAFASAFMSLQTKVAAEQVFEPLDIPEEEPK